MAKRNLYLKTTPVDEAQHIYIEAIQKLERPAPEMIPVEKSLGRVTAKAVHARCCSPLFNAAAMDGIAVISAHTKGASEANPLTLTLGEDYVIVDTGDSIHAPYDAVIMAEDLLEVDENHVTILAAVPAWQHIRPIGEDIVVGEMLMPGFHKIRPIDIGVMISGGILKVEVLSLPKVGILPTGTEIIDLEALSRPKADILPTGTESIDQKALTEQMRAGGTDNPGQSDGTPSEGASDIEADTTYIPKDGDIIESNSRMFEAMVTSYGGIPTRYRVVEDDYEKIKAAIQKGIAENDIMVVNAGSSAGTEDYTVHILRELGEVLIHGVAIKPGKPVILAIVEGKPVIGLPGYPVSAYIDFENFVKPVMALYTGESSYGRNRVEAVLSKRMVSSLKHKEYVRVKMGQVGDKLVASPLARGAGAAMSLVRADGFCVIEQNQEGLEAGEKVMVELYRDLEEIRHTVVSIGSHDLILDILADLMPTSHPGTYLSSTHVGSMGGLMALKSGSAHVAPTHLLDENTGEYNDAYIRRLFPGKEMILIRGVRRIQGIMVKKGNPLGIQSIADLTRCRYINRQRGAGTRVLLDYLLKKEGIAPAEIDGYSMEAATHMAVAALVGSESADAGMGIQSAADAMGLDFIPIGEEEYDFAMKKSSLELPEIQAFLSVLRSEEFRARVTAIGGYRCDDSGEEK